MSVAPVAIRELDEEAFQATFAAPMRRLGFDEDPPIHVDVSEYVTSCIATLKLPTTLEEIELHHVYVASGARHTHLLLGYGTPDVDLVLVIDNASRSVLGHRILNLGKLYGFD